VLATARQRQQEADPSYVKRIIDEVEREIKMCERVPRDLKA
jgi:hypothetical protein